MKQKFLSLLLSVSILFSLSACSVKAEDTIEVFIDGKQVSFDVAPQLISDRVMVPMRAIFEALGASIDWDETAQSVTAQKDDITVKFTVGKEVYYKNDKEKELDAPAVLVEDRVLVPVRYVAKAIGNVNVLWDGDKNIVNILSKLEKVDNDDWKENTGTIDLDTMKVTGDGIRVSENTIYITEGGDWTVTGTLKDGMIQANADSKVKLRLSDASITNENGPAIYFADTAKAFITLEDGTQNTVSDGSAYGYDTYANGAIYADDDLEIKGSGSLQVIGNYQHAISAEEKLSIANSTVSAIATAGDAIHADGDFTVDAANITAEAAKDGLQSGDDLTITSGTITVNAAGDAIVADEDFVIDDGTLLLTATGEAKNTSGNMGFGGGMKGEKPNRQWNNESDTTTDSQSTDTTQTLRQRPNQSQMQPNEDGTMPQRPQMQPNEDGTMPQRPQMQPNEDGTMPQQPQGGQDKFGTAPDNSQEQGDQTEDTLPSSKGIKAGATLTVNGGSITVTANDTAMHSVGDFTVNGGTLNLTSKVKKGIQGHANVTLSGGTITVNAGNEGIETKAIMTLSGADIDVTAGDDGLNAGGGSQRMNEGTPGLEINITGGTVRVHAQGDGIDSNGSISMSGGTVTVDGPTSDGNGALDKGGKMTITGGTLIAVGSSGMAEHPDSEDSTQYSVAVNTGSYSAGSVLSLKNASGTTVMTYTTTKNGASLVYSSPLLKKGEAYTAYNGDTLVGSFTISDLITKVGSFAGGNMGQRGIRTAQ